MTRKPKMTVVPFLTLKFESGSQSLYRGLYEGLREAILTGRLAAGVQLPSTRSLAAQFNISRSTVVNAYEQLYAEGYITGKTGAGTFVAATLPEDSLETRQQILPKPKEPAALRENDLAERGKRLLTKTAPVMRLYQNKILSAFQHGVPALDEFPFELWAKLTARRWRNQPRELVGYGDPAGYRPLREAISAYLKAARAVNCQPEQVIVVAGAQQALDLAARVLLNAGDAMWIEDPCYNGARAAFAAAGAKLVGVPVDTEGLKLNEAIKGGEPGKCVYITPSRQFPLGATMSLPRRLALLEWANQAGAWIIEDDYDSEYRYAGRPLAALQGLDKNGRVIYVGTFSKTVFPGLRLGCLVVPPSLVEVFSAARFISDWHSSLVDQAVLTDFIVEGHFARHVRRMRSLYKERQEILVAETKRKLAGLLDVAPAEAGMHLVGWLPEGICDQAAAKRAAAHGVEVTPVSSYRLSKICDNGLLLGFAAFDETQIKDGVRRLAVALN
ncbi:MAG: PLP-dependent aminotransferase family protein [Pyrinomonadaceae bacterium]